MLSYTPTPVQEIFDNELEKAGVQLLVKREDLNHPYVSGNKWWKLKYNLEEASHQNKKKLLTFGGAFSNHIYATAAAAAELGLESIGIIRGEETSPLNPTLTFAKKNGMQLEYVSREVYRTKNEKEFIQKLEERFNDFYSIPEGGSNQLALKGCEEFAHTYLDLDFNHLFLPVGTGGTMAGIIAGLENKKNVIGISVLKNGAFLKEDIESLLRTYTSGIFKNWSIETGFDHGGYAKSTPTLQNFIQQFERDHAVPLEHVYSGKMFWGIMDLIKKRIFSRGTVILAIHTGGLQGRNKSKIFVRC